MINETLNISEISKFGICMVDLKQFNRLVSSLDIKYLDKQPKLVNYLNERIMNINKMLKDNINVNILEEFNEDDFDSYLFINRILRSYKKSVILIIDFLKDYIIKESLKILKEKFKYFDNT